MAPRPGRPRPSRVGDCRGDVAKYRLVTRLDGDPVAADYLGALFDP